MRYVTQFLAILAGCIVGNRIVKMMEERGRALVRDPSCINRADNSL